MTDELAKRMRAAEFLTDLRFNQGISRKWISEKMGIKETYVSWAAANSLRQDKRRYLCPYSIIEKILTWDTPE